MTIIKWIFLLLVVLGTLLYWVSLTDVERTLAPWALRKSLLYFTGIISFVTMTFGMILAMRLRTVERWVGGLDTHYRLHKWLIVHVQTLTDQAGIPLHLAISGQNPALTARAICNIVPDFSAHTVWFCGATHFGEAIQRGLLKEGLPARRFHQELFEIR